MSRDGEILQDYLDGALAEEERSAVEERLATDAKLRAELGALRSVVAAARDLPRSIEPDRDLWPDIEEKITRGKIVRFGPRELLAVAAAVLIFFAGIITGISKHAKRPQQVATAPSAAELLDRVEREYATASDELFRSISKESSELDPETVELIRRNLAIIDDAILDIRAALEEDPENPGLNRLLTAEYRRRSALLRLTAGLADAI